MSPAAESQPHLRNILFVWEGLTHVGGVQLFLLQALRYLPEFGFQPYVLDIDSEPGPLAGQFAPFASFILSAPELTRRGTTLYSTGIWEQLQQLGIELVVINEGIYSRILQDLPPALPVILICHVDPDDRYYHNARVLAYRLQAIVAVSQSIANKLRAVLPPERHSCVRTIQYGVESYVARNQQDMAAPPLRLIYIGRLEQKQKRIYDLTPFVKTLNARGVDYELTIVGTGEAAADLQAALVEESQTGRVRFVGPLPHNQAMVKLGLQHLYLLFSDYEGLPISLLEALVCGVVPVVTAIQSGISEILVDGVNARLFPVGQPETAAAIVAELAHDPASLRALRAQALALGAQFKSKETFRRYAELFTEATALVDDTQSWWTDASFRRRQRLLALVLKLTPTSALRMLAGLKSWLQ